MLINEVRNHEVLKNFLCENCEEHGIAVVIDDKIESADFEIIKPDEYYNSLKIGNRPAAPDCFILVRCKTENQFGLTIVELKKANSFKDYKQQDLQKIKEKFENCLSQFMVEDFPMFDIDYKTLKLYFISRVNPYKENRDSTKNLKLKLMQRWKFEFRKKRFLLKLHLPNPTVKPCY